MKRTYSVLFSIVLSLDPVPIQFQTAPVLVQTGGQAVITVVTISNVLSISWISPGGAALGVWVPGGAVVSSGGQFNGRVTITATQLQISSIQLMDAGNFTVTVIPSGATGLGQNSRSVEMRVYDAVNGVNLFIPSVALEGGNISLTCTWTQGTQISVIWGKGGTTITPNSRVTISGGSLVINPGNRSDAGVYSCTVSNAVSAKTATASLIVYFGPDTPTLQLDPQANCVGGGQAEVGQTVKLTCQSASLPPALFSWQKNGQSVTADQLNGGVITLQSISSSQSGQYVCVASNAITTTTAQQAISLTVVGICLSVGAVAGIVIGCVLAIILIIIAIILLLCWRKKKHRLRQDTRESKLNGNLQPRTPPFQTAPTGEPTRSLTCSQRPDPPLHNSVHLDRVALSQHHACALPQNGHHETGTVQQNGLQNPSAPEPLGLHQTSTFADQGHVNGDTVAPSGQHNLSTLQHNSQQNRNGVSQPAIPSILIQTEHMQPGSLAPAIHVTLNTVLPTEQHSNNSQLQTIHLNLNASPNQQNTNVSQNASTNQPNAALLPNPNHHSPMNFVLSAPPPLSPAVQSGQTASLIVAESGVVGSATRNGAHISSTQIQTDSTHPTNCTGTDQRNAITQTYWPNPRRAQHSSSPRHAPGESRQLPWDNPHGTPAYPNRPSTLQESGNSSSSTSESQHGGQSQNTNPQSRPMVPRSITHTTVQTTTRDPIRHTVTPQMQTQTQSTEQNVTTHHPNLLTVPAPQNQGMQGLIRAQNPNSQQQHAPQNSSAPVAANQNPPTQTVLQSPKQTRVGQPGPANLVSSLQPITSQRPVAHSKNSQAHHVAQNPDGQRQNPNIQVGTVTHSPNVQQQVSPQTANNKANPAAQAPSALTQTALKKHTAQTSNPFQNRNEQTRAALARQVQQPGRRPPTPPPVIPLAQFQALPRQHLPESHPRQPQVTLQPVTHAHLNGHQLPGHVHPSMQRLPETHRHLRKQRQAPEGRPRR